MSLTIHFVRHGETFESRDHRFCGSTDCALSDAGRKMADYVARRCAAGGDWRAIYCSPLSRTVDTARPVAARLGLPISLDDGLREIAHGAWEGLTADEARLRDPELFDAWNEHAGSTCAPLGESGYEVAARAMPVVMRIRAEHPEGDVLVVSHKATIRILVCTLLGIDVDLFRARVAQPVATFTTIEFTARGPLLLGLADGSHLPPELRAAGGV